MRISELDDTEKRALLESVVDRARADLSDGRPLTQMQPRPGERIQEWWCQESRTWYRGSVLGGPCGDEYPVGSIDPRIAEAE
jgi:hypothetical protein